jgi:drug/metabolite transporter (DMT)-like permease
MELMNKKQSLATLALIAVTIIWGSGFIATQFAIDSRLPTPWIMMIRFIVGALCIFLFFRKQILPTPKKTILHGVIAGVILYIAFYTQTVGQGQTTISNAAFLTATNIIMIPFLLWIFTKKRPPLRIFALCLLTMLGVILLTYQGGFSLSFTRGDWMVLLCALFFAMHITWLDYCGENDDPVQIAFWQLLTAGVLGAFVVLLTRTPATSQQLQKGLLPVLYLGVFSTGVCYFLQTWGQKYVRASQAGIILSAEGFFGTLFSLLLGLEEFRLPMLFGGILITLSIILAQQPEKPEKTNQTT